MEVPDLLHTVWLGVAKDAIGSLLLDICEFGANFQSFDTWDEHLQAVTISAREWCRQRQLAPSMIDDFSSFPCSNILKQTVVPEELSKNHSLRYPYLIRLGEALCGCCDFRLPFRA